MFLSYKKNADTHKNADDSAIVVAASSNELTKATTAALNTLFGLEEALQDLEGSFPTPRVELSTIAVGASMVGNMATEITSLVIEGPEKATDYALAANGCSLAVSNGAQIYKFYTFHKSIQDLQHKFIAAILPLIAKCSYFVAPGKQVVLEKDGDYKEKAIFDFMYKHGGVTIQLKVPGTTFTLIDNSFSSMHVSGPTAAALGVTALSYGLSIGYRLAGHLFDEHSTAEIAARISSSVVPTLPFVDVSNAMKNWLSKQRKNILQAIDMVMQNVYLKQGLLHEMPLSLLSTLDYYLSKEDMQKNYELHERSIIASKDLEIGKLRDQVAALGGSSSLTVKKKY